MSLAYRAVGWNPQKRRYDAVLAGLLGLYLFAFVGVGLVVQPNATIETHVIRALGTSAFVLLHAILSIGPLCRLDPRWLPLLYNRRHLGVTMCALAAAHGVFAVVQFHALGNVNPLVSVLTTGAVAGRLAAVPFQPFGLAALLILVAMAATSHDFWLRTLTPPVWKGLHMGVYVAWALLIAHVSFGLLQSDTDPRLAGLVAGGVLLVLGLQLSAGWKERRLDRPVPSATDRANSASARAEGAGGFVAVCRVSDIPEQRARVFCLGAERVAVFRYDGRISALSNVCQHQNGPLGEGRIVNGCVVCPWHGYEYRPRDGASPPPFTEKVPTFRVRVDGDQVLVDPRPLPPGTDVEPAMIEPRAPEAHEAAVVGQLQGAP